MANVWIASKSGTATKAAPSFPKMKEKLCAMSPEVTDGEWLFQRVSIGKPSTEKLCALINADTYVEEVYEEKKYTLSGGKFLSKKGDKSDKSEPEVDATSVASTEPVVAPLPAVTDEDDDE